MTPTDVLDDIISHISPEQIPVEYIIMAKVTDFEGVEHLIAGAQLKAFMQHPKNFSEVRVVLNVGKIRERIVEDVNTIYDAVNKQIAKRLK